MTPQQEVSSNVPDTVPRPLQSLAGVEDQLNPIHLGIPPPLPSLENHADSLTSTPVKSATAPISEHQAATPDVPASLSMMRASSRGKRESFRLSQTDPISDVLNDTGASYTTDVSTSHRKQISKLEFDVECAILQAIAAQRQLADQVTANTRLEQQARELASQVCNRLRTTLKSKLLIHATGIDNGADCND